MIPIFFISQAAPPKYDIVDVFVWSLVLIALMLVAFAGVSLIRRWMHNDEKNDGPGFVLDDLRAMLANGTITREEFDKAKAQMTAAIQRAADRKKTEAHQVAETQANVWDAQHMRERRRKIEDAKKPNAAAEPEEPKSE